MPDAQSMTPERNSPHSLGRNRATLFSQVAALNLTTSRFSVLVLPKAFLSAAQWNTMLFLIPLNRLADVWSESIATA
jgi:hypothetical protein